MLVRVSGGREGVAQYLRHGVKAGRAFTREQLDERMTLAGDLELTDALVRGMVNQGNRYLHVTLAFKEDHVPPEALRAIVEEFRAFTAAAYAEDEFNFYAEAHLPRIKHYSNRATGEQVERKPHIHIVIPQKNLLSGEHLNPFGIGERSNEFLKAFQERINATYGLASPDDHSRHSFNIESALLSRYKGDQFAGAHRELKEKIRDDVLQLGIESREDFHRYLAEHWETSTVNSRGRECFAIRPDPGGKRVRLTEAFFSAEHIARPTTDKLARQQQDAAAYVATQTPRPVLSQHLERETYWHEVRAKEIKYLNSGRRAEWGRYKAMDDRGRAAFLAEKEAAFYGKHRADLEHAINALEQDSARHLEASVRVARRHRESGRTDDGARAPARERPGDTVAGTLLARLQERHRAYRGDRLGLDEIKQRLAGERLLKHLSHTHGVEPAKYLVHRTAHGDRIQCGGRSYNVTDFCTKEMHLPFAEAAPILRECYAGQQRELRLEARPRPREALWQDYTARWRGERRQEAKAAIAEQRARHAEGRRAITEQYRKERAQLSADRTIYGAAKQAARSVLRVRQLEAEAALRKAHAAERERVAEQYPSRPTFADYLQDQAQRGVVEALNELRRQSRPEVREPEPNAVAFVGHEAAESLAFAPLAYRVARNGDVTYYDHQGDVMRDETRRVQALRCDDQTLAIALRVAERKFFKPGQPGPITVALAGNEAHVRRTIEVAVQEGINVRFANPTHESMRRELQARYRSGRDVVASPPRDRQQTGGRDDRKNAVTPPATSQDAEGRSPAQEATPRRPRGRNDRGMSR